MANDRPEIVGVSPTSKEFVKTVASFSTIFEKDGKELSCNRDCEHLKRLDRAWFSDGTERPQSILLQPDCKDTAKARNSSLSGWRIDCQQWRIEKSETTNPPLYLVYPTKNVLILVGNASVFLKKWSQKDLLHVHTF